MTNNKSCTIVTTRHSGGSYWNRVEPQNGCLALAHSYLFVTSTLNGHNFNEKGLDSIKLPENLNAATEEYINRVDGAPCGDTPIRLQKGANDQYALIFMNGVRTFPKWFNKSQGAVEKFKSHSVSVLLIGEIRDARNNHLVKSAADKCVFLLVLVLRKAVLMQSARKESHKVSLSGVRTVFPSLCYPFQYLMNQDHGRHKWFHYQCVDLRSRTIPPGKWFCPNRLASFVH